ncbi:MAG TPA: hypothetical protein VJ019_08705, partial [Aestuariivirga sp.]|nr:hypothetical protein [Aestuariivirga sp.]
MNRFPAIAGWMARPERGLELRAWRVLPPDPPAGETPRLARQILERELEGLEPPSETFGTHEAIRRRRGDGYGRARRPQDGCHRGIASEDMDARGIARELSAVLAQALEVFPRIEELEGGRPASAAPPDWARRHRTRGSELHYKAARR